jgi:hypothetical protein
MAYTTIDDPSAHFQIALYSGNNTSQSITLDGNSDLQPDVVWIKERNGAEDHCIFDSSRSGSERLSPNTTGVTWDDASNVTAFDSDGFSVGSNDQINDSGNTQVAWCWKVNGGSRTTNAEVGNNPAGGYQVNATAGFSIVDYVGTGAAGTMAHGLGAVPDLIIIKNRDEADSWAVYHSANTSAPETDYMSLDNTLYSADDATYWNDTAPTSSVFTVATAHNVNADAENYIAYCFRSVQGYSKFGSYTGNGDADGPFIYTGFKPAWVIYKISEGGQHYHWIMVDNKRQNPFNPQDGELYANGSYAEGDVDILDLLSNGFKCRRTHGSQNGDGWTYVYMAFAENPFVTSGGVPCTAR